METLRRLVAAVNTVVYGDKMSGRLTAEDWLRAGLKALAEAGFQGVKADVLARGMNVSRGSFYWHFENIEAFQLALMRRWEDRATAAIIRQVESAAPPEGRLRYLMRLAFTANGALETAMRAWAATHEPVLKFLQTVDALRFAYLERLLVEAGCGEAAARSRARIIYWTYLGFIQSGVSVRGAELEGLIGSLAGLAGPA